MPHDGMVMSSTILVSGTLSNHAYFQNRSKQYKLLKHLLLPSHIITCKRQTKTFCRGKDRVGVGGVNLPLNNDWRSILHVPQVFWVIFVELKIKSKAIFRNIYTSGLVGWVLVASNCPRKIRQFRQLPSYRMILTVAWKKDMKAPVCQHLKFIVHSDMFEDRKTQHSSPDLCQHPMHHRLLPQHEGWVLQFYMTNEKGLCIHQLILGRPVGS